MKLSRFISLICLFISVLGMAALPGTARAEDNPIPDSLWYAVIWNQAEDMLYWANSATVQFSMPRPKVANENLDFGVRVHVSSDGRVLLLQGRLQNGRDHVSFYDLETASFIKTHETQEGEFNVATQWNPFNLDGSQVAVSLSNGSAWRVIAFDTATGDAIGQITSDDAALPADFVQDNWLPMVALYDIDEGLGQGRVHVRFIPQGPINGLLDAPSFAWIPELGTISALNSIPPQAHDVDFMHTGGRMLYTTREADTFTTDANIHTALVTNYDGPQTLYDESNALAYFPRWLYNGQFIGFRVVQQPFAPMWHIMPATGGESIPFAPDFEYMYGTPDGFLIVDTDEGVIRFSNTMQFEAFTPVVGNVIYQTTQKSFQVIYITPMGGSFELDSIKTGGAGVDNAVDGGIKSPEVSCPGAPPQRLEVGDTGRVTFTNGQPLNLRQSAAGERIGQLPEGTVFTVSDGPVCADGYRWFGVESTAGNGWVAEGDAEEYFIEPFELQLQAVTPVPTATQMNITIMPTATQPQRMPTADGDCSMAIEQEIQVGQTVSTVQDSGELSMRDNPTDALPARLIPRGLLAKVVGGPVCHGGFRLWRIELELNGENVSGWVSEGLPGRRFLGQPPRAR